MTGPARRERDRMRVSTNDGVALDGGVAFALRAIVAAALLSLTLWTLLPSAAKAAASAPEVTTERASAVTETGATLNATVDPDEANVTDCHFEYGPTVSYGSSAPCSSLPGSGENEVGVSATVEGLSESTTYHYRIVATNEDGTSYGTDRRFTTLPNFPTVVTNAASAIANTTATLNATVDPNSENVTVCEFEYGTSLSYGTTVPCTSLPGSGENEVGVSAPVSVLAESTTYHFRIVATNELGTSYGADRTFTTMPNAPTVGTEKASSVTKTTAALDGNVNPHGREVTSCYFEYGTSVGYGSRVSCSSLPGSGESKVEVSAPVAGLSESTTYHFRIVATNSLGTSYGPDRSFKTLPHAPSVVTQQASPVTNTEATLNASVDPNGGEVTSCYFEYGTSVGYGSRVSCSSLPGSGESKVEVSAPVAGLSESTTYHFRIVATNSLGTSYGLDHTLTTLPRAPKVLTEAASSIGPATATLNASVNPDDANVTSCYFEYGTSVGYGSRVSCSSLPGSGESKVEVSAPVAGLSESTTYHFRIVATNSLGTSYGLDRTFKTSERGLLPSIKKLSPHKGPAEGGTTVVIKGANFEGTTEVKFGSTEAKSFTVTSATSITAVSPEHAAGTVEVAVTTADGSSEPSAGDRFTFKAPKK